MRIHSKRLLAAVSVAAVTTLSLAGPAAAGGDDDRGRGGDDRSHSRDDDRNRDDRSDGRYDDRNGDDRDDRGVEIHVQPDESIQDAVDAAEPGDTVVLHPGEYAQNVTITTDHVSLVGHDAVLRPAGADQTDCDTFEAEPPAEGATEPPAEGATEPPADDEALRVSGICVFAEVEFPQDPLAPIEVPDPVEGVSVQGVTVEGATGDGLIALGTKGLDVRHSTFRDNGGYGAASFVGSQVTFEHDEATGNAEAGFYIGDSPEADAVVRDNESTKNAIGFFVRSASHGVARDNVAEGNCLGILVLADAPGPATDWEVRGNRVADNDKACTEEPPPVSGAGIVLMGATEFEVRDNRVEDNASEADSLVEGGIVVRSGLTAAEVGAPPEEFGASTAPTGEVTDNEATGNEPADVVWDETGDVEFDDNRCETSIPGGLCD